jgi:PAS domain S-box-containing protein
MLDVPIYYKGDIVGVICLENFEKREWKSEEIDFTQILSNILCFALYSRENLYQRIKMEEIERFIDEAALISKADTKGKITYVNKKFIEVSGYTLQEVLGKDHNLVNSGTHPKEFWKQMYKTVLLDRDIWHSVVTNRKKDGTLYYVDSYIKADFDPQTKKLEGYLSIRQDVTDLKIKENEIRNRMIAINRSNAVIEFDLDGIIMFANGLFCKLMGYEEKDIVGKHHSIFLDDRYKNSQEYKDFWANLREGNFATGEFSRYKSDGSIVWLQSSYNPIIGYDGKPYKIMKICQDITEKVLQSQEIEKKNTYLEHAAKILRHDMHSGINTYIPRGITSLGRRITDDDIRNLKLEAPLKMIKEGLKHAQKVYSGVYEFTNLVKKDACLTKKECNIGEILNDYLSTTAYKSQVEISDNLPTLVVNESLFCTSLDNLIRNGLKYNDSTAKIVKVYFEEPNLIILEDNGRGMSNEDFLHLSKPYVRKENQSETGSGLGLNICIAILKEHNFEISSEKSPECGTKIKIKVH